MADEKRLLERPLVVAFVAFLGAAMGAAASIGIYSGLAGGGVTTDSARVANCVRTHNLAQVSERRDLDDRSLDFRSCSWPAPRGGDPDGFTYITVRTEEGPGKTEVQGDTVAHVLTSACRYLEVDFFYDYNGKPAPGHPFLLTKGETREVEGSVLDTPPPPGPDDFVVLSNGRYSVDIARCV